MKKNIFLITLILFCYNLFATIRIVPIQYASIQTALDSSSTGDTVLVQPGTYFENIYWPNVANIKLFSDGDSSNTVINGGGLKAVITLDGDIMSVTIDTNTVIKGFKITGGGCTVGFFCGGMHMYKCSPKITEVSITENYSTESVGAGIVATDSNFSLSNSSVTFNALGSNTSLSGAGVYVGYGSPVFNNVDISGNSFGDNTSWNQGAGICLKGCTTVIINNVLVHHNEMGNGGTFKQGGGIYIDDCDTVLINSLFIFNNYMGNGGSSVQGGGMYLVANSIAQLNNVSVHENIMGVGANFFYGGGISFAAPQLIFENSIVYNNQMGNGGGVYGGAGLSLGGDSAYFKNVLIASNQSGQGTSPFLQGGAIKLSGGTNLNMINCTLADNKTLSSNNIDGTGLLYSGSATIFGINCILWNSNQGTEIVAASGTTGTANFMYSDIRGGFAGIGNLDSFPNFVSLADFHLSANSPCLNAGTLTDAPPYDLDNMPRPAPITSNPDMGCFELNQPLSLNEIDKNNIPIEIFPNPAAGKFLVTFKKIILDGKIEILDLFGRRLLTENILNESKKEINLKNVSSGIYFVRVFNGKRNFSKSIIVENDSNGILSW